MKDRWTKKKEEGREKAGSRMHYRDTLKQLKGYLRPVEPDPDFSSRLEEMCESMGALELFVCDRDSVEEGGHRGVIIGGAIFSALPFVGVAAYAISKHLLRRRVVPIGA
jgi:hypothetical protein